ncbi:hypothetical protein FGO68_gene7551 [Halteria grandinella]|uniref:Uncharacterized protein n=1 Tax=Halteria grandinella TaxID=5974 RepID=A0A8J8SZS3_HALGN|nr:hypothetical protein FGO68_gene7551 [Halteria grandinella]
MIYSLSYIKMLLDFKTVLYLLSTIVQLWFAELLMLNEKYISAFRHSVRNNQSSNINSPYVLKQQDQFELQKFPPHTAH